MALYNHACTIAFEVISNDPHGEDITAEMLRSALLARINNLDSGKAKTGYDEMLEACLPPYDTYEVDA